MQRLREHIFFGLPIATTFSLGVWQVHRLGRKEEMIAARKARLASPPLSSAEVCESGGNADLENRRIKFSGRFLHEQEMLVGPRSAPQDMSSAVLQWGGSSGFLVVTPLVVESKPEHSLLVIRGWIPQRLASRAARDAAVVVPEQSGSLASISNAEDLMGVVKAPIEQRNRFTPDNNPKQGDWYYVDADAMSAAPERPPVIELLQPAPGGWPYPKTEADFLQFRTPPSTHVVYATTWFSLSAALAILTRARYRRTARLQKNARPG